jgi:hypothetical protein
MLRTGLRFVGLTRGISDFDPNGQSNQQTFYHFHPDEETLIRAGLALESSFAPPLTAYGQLLWGDCATVGRAWEDGACTGGASAGWGHGALED